jgi:hypothetical protein
MNINFAKIIILLQGLVRFFAYFCFLFLFYSLFLLLDLTFYPILTGKLNGPTNRLIPKDYCAI